MDANSFYMCASWEDGCGFFLWRDDAGDIRDREERSNSEEDDEDAQSDDASMS
jgi:hypothetical protein